MCQTTTKVSIASVPQAHSPLQQMSLRSIFTRPERSLTASCGANIDHGVLVVGPSMFRRACCCGPATSSPSRQTTLHLYKTDVFTPKCGTMLDRIVLAIDCGRESCTDYWKVRSLRRLGPRSCCTWQECSHFVRRCGRGSHQRLTTGRRTEVSWSPRAASPRSASDQDLP